MAKRLSGFDFWEHRFRGLGRRQKPSASAVNDSCLLEESPDTSSDTSPDASPDITTIQESSSLATHNTWPKVVEPTEPTEQPQHVAVQTVTGVHSVRNSLSAPPSLEHLGQSASVIAPNHSEKKHEFLAAIERSDSLEQRITLSPQPIDDTRPQSRPLVKTPLSRPSSLNPETDNHSDAARRNKRHSALPNFSTTHNDSNNTYPDHRHTVDTHANCTKRLNNQTDKRFEALADALEDKRRNTVEGKPVLRSSNKSFNVPIIRSPRPVRPKNVSKHLERAQRWAETHQESGSSTASSVSSPTTPTTPTSVPPNNRRGSLTTETIPMGCNLQHDLNDFLKWEARNVCAYGYGTYGYAVSP